MDAQTFINILFTVVGAMGGWILNNLKASIEALQKADSTLADKVQHIEVLVAGTYVKRDDLDKVTSIVHQRFDKLEEKIDKLAEK
jgi:peptidoglycan hydrolase CwlO-like protein